MDAPGAAFDADVERGSQLCHGLLRRIFRDLERSADEGFDSHVAEQYVGIGDSWLGAAALVGRRSRERAGRARANIEETELVLGRDGSSPGADLDHLDRLDLERKAGTFAEALVVGHFEVGADGRLAIWDKAEFGRGAAHVERQHARLASRSAEFRGGDRAGRRPRFNQTYGQFGSATARNEAAG